MSSDNCKKLKVPKAVFDAILDKNTFRGNIGFWERELKNSKETIAEKEKRAFTVNGVELSEKEKLIKEYMKLTASLAFDSDLETDEYSDVNRILQKLGDSILELDDDSVLYDAIKKLIVYVDMQIGCKLSFYSTFNEMLLYHELEYDYHKLKEMGLYNYKSLVTFFYDRSYRKMHDNENYIVKDRQNTNLKVKDWLNSERIDKLDRAIQITKEIDIKKYYSYKTILNQILEMLSGEIKSEDDILFVRKVLAYLECGLGIRINDDETISMLIIKEGLKELREKTIFDEYIDLDYLKEKFHYNDSLSKRKGG